MRRVEIATPAHDSLAVPLGHVWTVLGQAARLVHAVTAARYIAAQLDLSVSIDERAPVFAIVR